MSNSFTPERPSPNTTLLSLVLPVYNEAEVLPELVRQIDAAMEPVGGEYEILFANDGSSDASAEVLDRLADEDERIRVIHLSRNFGHQAAVQAGLAHARGDAVVLMDSDLQDAPTAIPRFVEQWRLGYDVVYALRRDRKESPLKRLLFSTFHRFMARIASVDVPANAGNFGLVDQRVARQIVTLGERDRYFPGLRSWVGFRQKGIEVERNARYDDCPRVSVFGLFRLAKTAIFSFSAFPLAIFHVIGIVATVLFLGLGGFALYCKLFTSLTIPGWTSFMLTGSFFGALNALGISILGEYVIRVYDQVRARPMYLVDRTVNVPPATEETADGDVPYTELMQEAVRLLQDGSVGEEPWYDEGQQPSDPVVLPISPD